MDDTRLAIDCGRFNGCKLVGVGVGVGVGIGVGVGLLPGGW